MSGFDAYITYDKNMDKKFDTDQYQDYYSLSKEERHRIAVEVAQLREQMFRDILEHNRRVLKHNERILEAMDDYEPREEIFFFSSAHPIISLFATWFANL